MPSTPTFITTSGPAVEPITLEEMKTRLRVSGCDFDDEVSDMLKAARLQVEADTYRKLITQTVVMYQEDFSSLLGPLDIRLAPIQSITHVKYYDRDDVLQTFAAADYYANLTSTPPEIRLKEAKQWPNTSLYRPNKVEVTMVAGYGATAASVPRAAKLAMVEYCRAIWDG
ncbi:MAG: hypothetical protein LW816_20815, partial [Planctomyces sp.]|nr:hypothetical protein [Planctomyces sp.]